MSYIDGKGNFYIAKLQTQIKDINKEIIIDPSNEYLLGGGCVKPIINEEKISSFFSNLQIICQFKKVIMFIFSKII